MSTLVGSVVTEAQTQAPDIPPHVIASAMAIICGGIVCFMGLVRLGFIVDFIPLPAISAFMTGSALNICSGQVKSLLGETADFSTRGATYEIIINTLKYLPTARIDAAMGVTALAMLYMIRSSCNYGAKKYPHRAKLFFFASTLRTVFVILFYTMISAAVNLHRKDNTLFKVIGEVPRGFQNAAVPRVDARIIKTFANQLPASVIVLLIEHLHDRSLAGDGCHWCKQPAGSVLGCLPRYWILLANRHQVQGWCSDPARWLHHGDPRPYCHLRPDGRLLLHPQVVARRCHHPRCRGPYHPAQHGLPVLASLSVGCVDFLHRCDCVGFL